MRARLIGIGKFAVRKIVGIALTLFGLATLVFFLLKLTPGDEARVVAGINATPEQVEAVRVRLGLSGSVWDQYATYMGRLLHGDLGVSLQTQGSITSAIGDVLPSTADLVVVAIVVASCIAIPLAAWSAMKSSGAGDSTRRLLVIIAAGTPTFWLALVLQMLLGAKLGIFPISGRLSVGVKVPKVTGSMLIDTILAGNPGAFMDALWHILLPALVMSVPFIGALYRVVRSELLRVLTREHVTVATAAGVGRGRLMRRHVIPQVLNPTFVMIGMEFGGMFGGAILVESIFGRNGLGSYLTNAVTNKDTTAVLGGVLVIGVIVVFTSLIVDLIQLARDPRIRSAELGA